MKGMEYQSFNYCATIIS